MQLKTVLISIGTLALSASITLGKPAPVIPATEHGKGANNGDLVIVMFPSRTDFHPGDWIILEGVKESNGGPGSMEVMGDIFLNAPDIGYYDPDHNLLGVSLALTSPLRSHTLIGEGHTYNWTIPSMRPVTTDNWLAGYSVTFQFQVLYLDEWHGASDLYKTMATSPTIDIYIPPIS